jgi:rubrerythrin
MELHQVLLTLEQLEGALADAYEIFSQRFGHDLPLAQTFARLSAEELAHQNLVRYELRMVRQNPKLFGEVRVDVALLDRAARAAALLKRLAPTLDPANAVWGAAALEKDAAESYYRTLIQESHPDSAKFIQAMAGDCAAHAERLRALATARNWVKPHSTP